MRRLIGQFARFGVVGLVGFVIDFAVFNLLRATVFSPEDIHEGPVYAKIISTSIAILANWIGNRYWTFREHRGRQLFREGIEFAIVSLGGMVIGLALPLGVALRARVHQPAGRQHLEQRDRTRARHALPVHLLSVVGVRAPPRGAGSGAVPGCGGRGQRPHARTTGTAVRASQEARSVST